MQSETTIVFAQGLPFPLPAVTMVKIMDVTSEIIVF